MTQIFEVLEVREFPYFVTIDIDDVSVVGDIINVTNSRKVHLLVDHYNKRIWTHNGQNSPFKLQIFGGILAGMLRKQLKLFYRVYALNMYSTEDPKFQEVMVQSIEPGRAQSITKDDFPKTVIDGTVGEIIIHNPGVKKAMETINPYVQPKDLKRIFLIIAGNIYSEEDVPEAILKEERYSTNLVKMGRLNNGFTFFKDRNYSTRIIVKNRTIQGIELYVNSYENLPSLRIKSPIIHEEKISNEGDMDSLMAAFQIPDSLPDVESEKKEEEEVEEENKT
ncbi:MAG: hypothetical protein ACTSQL_05415 [Promethearchaeota archaeon]